MSEEDNEALKRFVAAYLPIRTCYLIAAFAFLDLSQDRVKEFVIDLEDIIPEKDDEEDSPDAHMMQEPSSSVVVAFRIYSRISVLDAGLFEFLTNLRSAGTAIGIPLSEELILLDPIPAFRAAMCQYLRSDFQGALNWAEKCESVLEQRQVHLGDGESDVQDGPDVELVKVRQLEHSFLLFRFSDTSDFILDDLIDKIDRIDFRNGTEEWTPTRLRIVCGTFLVCCYLWSKVLENSRGSRHSPRLGTSIQKLASLLGDLTSSPQEGTVTRQFEKIYYRIAVNWLDLFRDQDPTYDFDDLVGRIDTIDWHPREMKDFWLESVQIIEVSRGFCDLGWDEISEEVVAERQSAIFGTRRRNPLDAMPSQPATGATVDRLQKGVQLGVGATTLIKNVLDLIARFSD